MPLLVRLNRSSVQDDDVNQEKADEDGAELRSFKRVIVKGLAKQGGEQQKVKVILELRAGLLGINVSPPGSIHAGDVGRAIVFEMGRYYHVPITRLLVRRTHSATRSEWIATDPARVSGLLHQVQEGGEFEALLAPPDPPGLRPILSELAEDLQRNLQEGLDLAQQARDGRLGTGVQGIDNSLWIANREILLELVPSRHLRTQMVRLYEALGVLHEAVRYAQQHPPQHQAGRQDFLVQNAYWPARAFNIEFQRIFGLGQKVLRQIATTEQLKQWGLQPPEAEEGDE